MKNIVLQKMSYEDTDHIVDIWYEASILAHNFISEEYWKTNKGLMKTQYIPMSDTYTATVDNNIVGFISLVDDYLAAIFVKPNNQGKGVGTALINHAKNIKDKLQLKVFVKNQKSVDFYIKSGFTIKLETTDIATDEKEFKMEWCR